jgi:predicted nucleic acid-binding protein
MIVVSDTTPIHYLILIGKESILPQLFGKVIIPDVVISEMSHPNAPATVRDWVTSRPDWAVSKSGSESISRMIMGLGKGETSAIAIAIETEADLILMDDRRAIREATIKGLNVLTTFALLELASIEGLIDFASAIDALAKTNFHMPSETIIQDYLKRNMQP